MGDSVEEKKRRRNERAKQQYADDPECRKKAKARARASKRKNKDAINARQRLRYETDPEYRTHTRARGSKAQRKSNLKRKYGLSLEGYATMLARQNGVCAICFKEQVSKPLAVDHDHKRRMLRNLLCDACNKGLGNFRDDSALMRRGADYLDFWRRCHESVLNTGPPPAKARNSDPHGVPIHHFPVPKGGIMTPTNEPTEDNKTSRMVRRALLHELLQPFDPDPPPPVDMLQAVSRAIVVKASQGDMTAAKEVFERIDGKTLTIAPASADIPQQVFFTWKPPV
jgi:hypothetical protein